MLMSVDPTCFNKNENQKLKSDSKKLRILTSALELRICKRPFAFVKIPTKHAIFFLECILYIEIRYRCFE
jgi:hypothetical protein